MIATGTVDGGIGFYNDQTEKVEAIRVPIEFYVITISHFSVAKASTNQDEAKEFGKYLESKEAKAIFKKYHLETP